ncbi:MAG: ABC transporter substrate-binding protein [Alphaproteobacteria bacterium]|nr:ABC transporter substrate-binding protein [Alphaproteobacteria bacterium]
MNRLFAAPVALALILAATAALAAKDTIVIGMQDEPPVLDPTQNAAAAIDVIFSVNVYESLTRIGEDGTVKPGLASSWAVGEDGKVYTFKLPKGVTFDNGEKLTSANVKWSFERAGAADSTNPTKRHFGNIAGIETPDPETVVLRLKQPSSLFLSYMASGGAAIFDPKSAEGNKNSPVGTGPYKFKQWVKGDRVVLEKSQTYRDAGKVQIRQATFKFVPDAAAQVPALLTGDIDAFPVIGATETLDRFKGDSRFQVVVGSTEGEVPLILNNGKKPFDDIRVRRAVNHAIERKSIIDGATSGYGVPIGSHFPPHHPWYVDLTNRYPHDIAKAKELLKEAGYANGLDINIKPPPFAYARRSAEIVASQLADAGIRVKIEPVEWAQWLDIVYKQKNYDMTVVAHVSPWDQDNYSRGKDYYYGYQNEAFDKLMKAVLAESDEAKQKDLYGQIQRMIAEEAVHAFMFQLPRTGVYAAKLRGFWKSSPVSVTDLAGLRWVD